MKKQTRCKKQSLTPAHSAVDIFDFGLAAANARGFSERSSGTHANQWGVLTMDDDDSIVFGSQDVM